MEIILFVQGTSVDFFLSKGYLVVENFFRPEELNACRDAIKLLVDSLATKLYNAGKIKSRQSPQMNDYNSIRILS